MSEADKDSSTADREMYMQHAVQNEESTAAVKALKRSIWQTVSTISIKCGPHRCLQTLAADITAIPDMSRHGIMARLICM